MTEVKNFDRTAPIKSGWELMKQNFWFLAGLVLIQGIFSSIDNKYRDTDASFPISLIILIIDVFLSIGILKIILNLIDRKPLSYSELWQNSRYFWRYLGASVLYGLLVALGLLLLIVPGIYWATKYQYTTYLIVDKDMGITDAFKKSGEITKERIWDLFAFNIILLGIIILGALALVIGLFAAIPVVWIAFALVYRSFVPEKAI